MTGPPSLDAVRHQTETDSLGRLGVTLTTRRPRRVPNSTWPCDQREQGVVAAAADPVARVEVGAALPDDDLAGVDQLAAEALDAEPLGVGVATVARRGRALLVCHVCLSSRSR